MDWSLLPRPLFIAVAVQVSCQVFKFGVDTARSGRPSWRSLVAFGGMPSAHSAFVTALAASLAVFAGFGTDAFAVAVVFGGIVIFDAWKLRGAVQKQAEVLNRLQAKALPEAECVRLSEHVGHSGPEIVAGIAVALVVAVPLAWWLK